MPILAKSRRKLLRYGALTLAFAAGCGRAPVSTNIDHSAAAIDDENYDAETFVSSIKPTEPNLDSRAGLLAPESLATPPGMTPRSGIVDPRQSLTPPLFPMSGPPLIPGANGHLISQANHRGAILQPQAPIGPAGMFTMPQLGPPPTLPGGPPQKLLATPLQVQQANPWIEEGVQTIEPPQVESTEPAEATQSAEATE